MAYNTKAIKTDKDGNPISQYYNPETDEYEPVEGAGGGNKVILYNEDGTPNDSLSLGEILDKLDQLKGTVIDEETRKQNEQTRQQNEQDRIDLYNALKDLDVSQYELRLQKLEHDTSVEETVVEEAYGPVIPLPENVVNGQVSTTVAGQTATNLAINGKGDSTEGWLKQDQVTITEDGFYEIDTSGIVRVRLRAKTFAGRKYLLTFVGQCISGTMWALQCYLSKGGSSNADVPTSAAAWGILLPRDTELKRRYAILSPTDDGEAISIWRTGLGEGEPAKYHIKEIMLFDVTDMEGTDEEIFNEINTKFPHYFSGTKSTVSAIRLKGTQATEYEPYKESTLYVIAKDEEGNILELRSLPNGTKDEINVSERKLIKRIEVKSNITSGTIINFIDMAEGGTYFAWNENGETETGNKGDTLGINATVLTYQLAEPIEMPIEVFGNLQSYENGTVYVDTIVPRVDFYTSEGIVLAENDVPIKEIDKLYLVNKENGYLTELDTSKAFIFPDGKGLTHPDSYNDALVDWDYVPDVEGTNPGISMKLPTNLKASVTSTLQGVQELSNKTKKLDTRVIANHRDIYNLQGDFVALQSNVFEISNELDTHKADSVTDDAHGWNSALRFKAGMFSRNTTLASGTQVIDGLGFKPKAIIALAFVNQGVGRMSIGMYDGDKSVGLLDGYNNTANAYISLNALVAIRQGADSSSQYVASVASVNADGFVLNWVKGSDVSDGEIISVRYLAFR